MSLLRVVGGIASVKRGVWSGASRVGGQGVERGQNEDIPGIFVFYMSLLESAQLLRQRQQEATTDHLEREPGDVEAPETCQYVALPRPTRRQHSFAKFGRQRHHPPHAVA